MRTTLESLAALDRLEQAGSVTAKEGWSPGRVLAHCAQSVVCSLEGYPQSKGALFQATAGKVAMSVFLRRGTMKHDVQAAIPGAPDCGEPTLAEGLVRLRRALAAFSTSPGPMAPHFAYGAVSKSEYEALHAMHLADHLSRFEIKG